MGGERVSISPPEEDKDVLSPARFKAKQQKRRRKQEPTLKPQGMAGELVGEASSEQFSARKKKKKRKRKEKKKLTAFTQTFLEKTKGLLMKFH